MDDLATQQQEIVDCIAINWDAISVKEIAKITRLESKVISAQLRLLEKNNVVLKKATSTKNNLYQVKERFFNIWYIMRNGRKSDKKKVIWLTKFLEMWCDNETLDEMLENHISKLKKGSIYDKYAYHLAEAYASLTTSPEKQHQILAETRAYLKNCKSDSADSVSESDYEFLEKRIEPLLKQNEFEKAINLLVKRKSKTGILERVISEIYYTLLKDINKSKEFLEIAIKKGDITSMHNLAILYQKEFQDYKNAEKYFLMSIKHGLDDASYNLAVLYDTILEDKSKAEKYYLMAVKKGHLLAMNNLALLYHLNHDFEKAKDLYKGAIEKGNTYSMMNYANLLCENNKSLKEAEKYYLMAVRNNDINAMHEIALFYKNDFQDYDKSEKYFLLAIKNGHTDSLVSIANLYNDYLNEVEKSIKYYELAIEKGYKEAIFNLALLYDYKLNNQEKAEIYYLKSIENNNVGAINNLAFLYFLSSKNKENANDLAKKSFDKNPDNISRHTYSLILLWNNKIEDAIQISKPVFNDPKLIEERTDDVELLINMFIAKQQYNYVFKIFSENKYQIKDKLKPIYYALMHFMQDKYPDELKKMGEELEDTVNNIVDLILELRNKYK
jgi:TPR repeat protein